MTQEYVLGQTERAGRRLAIQDKLFADVSEQLLEELQLRPGDRVVEFGCGAGSFSRRVLNRLGEGGVLIGVDSSEGLLIQARSLLADSGPARFEGVLANVADLGDWLHGADAVVARTMLHHVPMAEFFLGKLHAVLRPDTRVGFIEPDFRTPLARLAFLEATTRPELRPLGIWAMAINQLYQAKRISPAVGATMGQALQLAGFRNVSTHWSDGPSSAAMLENMSMFYDEVRDRLQSLGILTLEEVHEQQRLLAALPTTDLPAVWGVFRVTAEVGSISRTATNASSA